MHQLEPLLPEFIPASHQYLLTVLSIWWAFGQLLGSLVRESRLEANLVTDGSNRSLGHSYLIFRVRPPRLHVPDLPMKAGGTSFIPWAVS